MITLNMEPTVITRLSTRGRGTLTYTSANIFGRSFSGSGSSCVANVSAFYAKPRHSAKAQRAIQIGKSTRLDKIVETDCGPSRVN